MEDPPRAHLADELRQIIATNQVTIVTGEEGLGQLASIQLALESLPGWEPLRTNGCLLTGGHLSGLQELIAQTMQYAEVHAPELIERHEQTLKRILPSRRSETYRVPKDLTNSSDREERTRFYHHAW